MSRKEVAQTVLCMLVFCAQLTEIQSANCPALDPLMFGQLVLDGRPLQPPFGDSQPGDVVLYQCARGYTLVNRTSSAVLSENSTLCLEEGVWTLVGVACLAVNCGSPPVVGNANVTLDSGESFVGDTATYRCTSQYQFDLQGADGSLVVPQDGRVTSVCASEGEWHVVPRCVAIPLLSEYYVLVIVLAIVATLCLCALCSTFICTIWAFKLRREFMRGDMADDEVAYAHSHGSIIVNNPMVTPKDDESVGNPLYLTPDEMDEFEGKKRQLAHQSG